MDPIEIEGPDGAINEFPAGTDDATIQAAMAKAYPTPAAGAEPGPGLPRDQGGNIESQNTWEGVNEAQALHVQKSLEDGSLDPNMPPGSDQNPYVIPEGLTDAEMADLVKAGVTYVDRDGRMQRKSDELYGLYQGAARPVINTLNWLENGVGLVSPEAKDAIHDFRLENMRSTTQEGNDEIAALAEKAGARPGQMGQFAGAVGATAPLALATRNPWLLGAAEGAMGSNAQDARGLAMDTAIGALAGKGGDVATKFVGSAIAPEINPAVRSIVAQGGEPSPGQVMGGLAHRMEDAIGSYPIVGDLPNVSQRRAQESVVRIAMQRPATSLGIEIPQSATSGHDMIRTLQNEAGRAYEDLLPQLDVRLDPDFATEFNSLNQGVRNMAAPQVDQWNKLIQNEVMPRFNAAQGPANGRITGESFKELESILGREVRDFSAGTASPHDRRYASAVRELQAQLRDMLARGNPAHAERLQNINDAYRQLTVLEDAVGRAGSGTRGRFTPAQLEEAAKAADPTVRKRAARRGDALFQDLSQDAGEVMNRTLGDSGTTTRALAGAGLSMAFLNKTMDISINPWAVGALALGAIPYNRTGNRLFTAAMTRRPSMAPALRAGVDAAAPFIGGAQAANNQIGRNEWRENNADMNEIDDDRNRYMDAAALQNRLESVPQ